MGVVLLKNHSQLETSEGKEVSTLKIGEVLYENLLLNKLVEHKLTSDNESKSNEKRKRNKLLTNNYLRNKTPSKVLEDWGPFQIFHEESLKLKRHLHNPWRDTLAKERISGFVSVFLLLNITLTLLEPVIFESAVATVFLSELVLGSGLGRRT